MSDLQLIKEKLVNEEKIEELLEAMDCEFIKNEQSGGLITCQLPYDKFESTNKRSCQVRLNESLACYIRTQSDFKGDIFSLISYIHHDKRGNDVQKDLYNAKTFVCKLFGWDIFLNNDRTITKRDYVDILKKIKHKQKYNIVEPNPILDEDILEQYYFDGRPIPYKGWIDEGISYYTQLVYGIGFDLETHRVTFAIRNKMSSLVGVKGRIIGEYDEDTPKYIYLYPCYINKEWFNLYMAKKHILKQKEVIIFEAEKSVFKCHSNKIYNTLAICSSDISSIQVNIIKELGNDIRVILAYDKDKTIEDIRIQANKFKGMNVYAVYDTEGLLGEKDSPIDLGLDVWNNLYNEHCYLI